MKITMLILLVMAMIVAETVWIFASNKIPKWEVILAMVQVFISAVIIWHLIADKFKIK